MISDLTTMLKKLVLCALFSLSIENAEAVCHTDLPSTAPTSDFQILFEQDRFTPKGVVIHRPTKLMWRRCPVGYNYQAPLIGVPGRAEMCIRDTTLRDRLSWGAAINSTTRASFSGYDGWRLPNIKELASIAEYQCFPTINSSIFPDTEGGLAGSAYWSASPSEGTANNLALTFDFITGLVLTNPKSLQVRTLWVRDTSLDFGQDIALTFKHPRCQNCHAVEATNFAVGGDANGVGLPSTHSAVTRATLCSSCHTGDLQPAGEIDPGWHAAPLANDLRNLNNQSLCDRATEVPGSATSAHAHLSEDRLILWSFAPKKPFGGTFEAAPPYHVEAWRDSIDLWKQLNLPCPTEP